MEQVTIRRSSEFISKQNSYGGIDTGADTVYELNNNTSLAEGLVNQPEDTNMNAGRSRSRLKKDEHLHAISKASVSGKIKKKPKVIAKKSASSASKVKEIVNASKDLKENGTISQG